MKTKLERLENLEKVVFNLAKKIVSIEEKLNTIINSNEFKNTIINSNTKNMITGD